VQTRLSAIARELRVLLHQSDAVQHQTDPQLWEAVEGELSAMLDRIRDNEWQLLSNRARHGLRLLKNLLPRYQRAAEPGSERKRICTFLQKTISRKKEPWVDVRDLADEWLGIVQPEYVEWKQATARGRSSPVRLKDMEGPLSQRPIGTDALRLLARSVRRDEPIKRRIVAAIIAVPMTTT